jgi:hypothetical protein
MEEPFNRTLFAIIPAFKLRFNGDGQIDRANDVFAGLVADPRQGPSVFAVLDPY